VAKILIVDDDLRFRRALSIALMAQGYQVSEAANGLEALDRMAANSVDVVLVDWRMPAMGGNETCRTIRALSQVPIIVISALDRHKEALAAGADAFFRKPLDTAALLARIEAGLAGH